MSKRIVSWLAVWICCAFILSACARQQYQPASEPSLIQAFTIAAGEMHNYAIDQDGVLWFWGTSIGRDPDSDNKPKEIDAFLVSDPESIMENVISVRAGELIALMLTDDGALWGWGNWGGLPSAPDGDTVSEPIKLMDNIISINARGYRLLAIDSSNVLWDWGSADSVLKKMEAIQEGAVWAEQDVPAKLMEDVKFVSTSSSHVLAVKTDDSLWSWGYNAYGQLGNGTTTSTARPSRIMADVIMAAAGENVSAAIKSDGTLWLWGSNSPALAAQAGTDVITEPVYIADGVLYAELGDRSDQNSLMYIAYDHSLWVVGYNIISGAVENDPVKIMDNAAMVDMCGTHVLALTLDGVLYGWGDNEFAQLGNGSTISSASPIKIRVGRVKVPEFAAK